MAKPNAEQAELEAMHWQLNLLGSIEVGIVVLDREYRVKTWNEFMHNHSGILPSKIRGQRLFEFFEEINEQWFIRKTRPVFELNSPAFLIWEQQPYLFKFASHRPVTSASELMYQNITLFPLMAPSGKVEHLCIMVYDVTDEVISKQQLNQANDKLQQMSRIDGLTGLYNRRFWEESCMLEFKRCMRNQGQASLLMLDIDHFKPVNDNYGHPAGDQVIMNLAEIIKTSVRETDIPGRYGGEEFAIVLPDTDAKSALRVAERIRLATEKTLIRYEQLELQVTISLGIAQLDERQDDYMAWISEADQALYQAKETGRNKVVIKS
ncbi:GGDEF domain-containing protein [Lacimicrobium alkaliphilum]|uniref:diguanylate cyclase n=1 Tax=Lacimicrobium alkaliphilum TaxID=1526571 RepID=A0A0U3AHK2_9ALTE|nr:sensor domain-containing diguanylate cyclase [Lacimicrobium alkaliphilum]ALS97538.1 diguanylate cyclase [Lacimicrobium alkaliphilum]